MAKMNTSNKSGSVERVAAGDSLATGLLFMLGVTVFQRLVGFTRSILFCGLLQDDELGRWSLAFSFFLLAAPLTVLGLPGSFGRYVAHFRKRGQLRVFLLRTVIVSSVLASIGVAGFVVFADYWAWLVFGDESLASLIQLMAITLAVVILSNFVMELLTATKQVRAVSTMQFVCSLMFAVLAVGLLWFTTLREEAIIIAYGLASLIALVVAIKPLRQVRFEATASDNELPHAELWRKLMPYAAWIWVTNILVNLFEVSDRFMIVHLSPNGSSIADSLVGQYHASRIVPFLLVGVSGMVAAIVLPHISHDWEAGKRKAVSDLQAMAVKSGALLLFLAGTALLVGAPLLFGWVLQHKYDQGMAVFPLTLTYCVWFSITMIAQTYLWCCEGARWGSLSLAVGLAVNIAFNFLLFPIWGLHGAVFATTLANLVTLALVIVFASRLGFAVDRDILICCSLPVLLAFGPLAGMAGVVAVAYFVFVRGRLFSVAERDKVWTTLSRYWSKFRSGRQSGQPAIGAE